MTFAWIFGARYNYVTGKTVSPCSREEARRAHVEGRWYGAVLWNEVTERAVAVIEINPGGPLAHVMLYDEQGHLDLDYVFADADEERPSELFLQEATYAHKAGEGEELREASKDCYWFRADGSLHHIVFDWEAGTKRTQTGRREPWALALHYEPVPEFGDFASLLRADRDRSVGEQEEGSASRLVADGLVS